VQAKKKKRDKIKKCRPDNCDARGKHAGRNYGSDGICRIVKTIQEIKGKR
jgi:hypothetical protein